LRYASDVASNTSKSVKDAPHSTRRVGAFLLGRRHYFKIKFNLKITFPVVKTLYPGEDVLNFWTESLQVVKSNIQSWYT